MCRRSPHLSPKTIKTQQQKLIFCSFASKKSMSFVGTISHINQRFSSFLAHPRCHFFRFFVSTSSSSPSGCFVPFTKCVVCCTLGTPFGTSSEKSLFGIFSSIGCVCAPTFSLVSHGRLEGPCFKRKFSHDGLRRFHHRRMRKCYSRIGILTHSVIRTFWP